MIPTDQAARLINQHTVANSVCASCHGALVEQYIDNKSVVTCPRCGQAGYISHRERDEATHQALTLADEAVIREPWTAPERPTVEQQRRFWDAMYGPPEVVGGE